MVVIHAMQQLSGLMVGGGVYIIKGCWRLAVFDHRRAIVEMEGRLSMDVAQLLGTGRVYAEVYYGGSIRHDAQTRTDPPLTTHFPAGFCGGTPRTRTGSDVGCRDARRAMCTMGASHVRARPDAKASDTGAGDRCILASGWRRRNRGRAGSRTEAVAARDR